MTKKTRGVLLFFIVILSLTAGISANPRKDHPVNNRYQSSTWQDFARDAKSYKDAGDPSHVRTMIRKRFGKKDQYAPDVLLVKYKKNVPKNQAMSRILSRGNKSDKYYKRLRVHKVRLKRGMDLADALINILDDPDVEYAEPDYRVEGTQTPNDPSYGALWGMPYISAPSAWNITTGGNQIVIGVIDTGSDQDHPDLSANFWRNSSGYTGWNAVADNDNPEDDHYHGTHTAGTIGAVGNNGMGVTGVNWTGKIMSLKFLTSGGYGYISDAVECMKYVLARKNAGVDVRLTSNSWGGGGYSQTMYNAIEQHMNVGILFVAAAGNSNNNNDANPYYPSTYNLPNVISVAAIDSAGNKASFSSYGASTVHLGAPGVSVYSTMPNNSYGYLSGTSMATPHVSGAIGLLLAKEPNLDWRQAKERLLTTARPLASMQGITITGGVIDVDRMLRNDSQTIFTATLPANNFEYLRNTDILLEAYYVGPIQPASISAVITLTGGNTTLTLKDDGIAPDPVSGDKYYSGIWTPQVAGLASIEYQANGRSAGVNGTITAPKTWYVNDTSTVGDVYCIAVGNNANSGLDTANPVRSFSAIQWSVKQGDTVLMDVGHYYENDRIYIRNDDFSLVGVDSASTVIHFGDSEASPYFYSSGRPTNVLLSDFRVTGGRYGFLLYDMTNSVIKNISSDNHRYYGMRIGSNSNNNKISNLHLHDNGYAGLYGYWSSNNVYENILSESNLYGIYLSYASGATIKNSTLRNSTSKGIYTYRAYGSTFENNLLSNNNGDGIQIYYGNSNSISNNRAETNSSGITLTRTTDNIVSGNTVVGNSMGVFLSSTSTNNTVANNYISGQTADGIYINSSDTNTVSGNIVQNNNNYGIYIYGSEANLLALNEWKDNNSIGVYLYNSRNNTFKNERVTGNGNSGIYFYNSDSNLVTDVLAGTNAMNGVYVNASDSLIIERTTAHNNSNQGFYLRAAHGSLLKDCLADSNRYNGFYLTTNSSGNTFQSDTSTGNGDNGFILYTITRTNTFASCRIEKNQRNGVYLYSSSNQVFRENTFSGNQYGLNTSNVSTYNIFESNLFTLNSFDGATVLSNGDSNTFKYNRFYNNERYGISFSGAGNIVFEQNTIDSNVNYGIMLTGGSGGDRFTKNNIIPGPYNPTRGLTNNSLSERDFTRNWWGTADNAVISTRVNGTGADLVALLPFRLNQVDTTPGADTIAPLAPASLWFDTPPLYQLWLNWSDAVTNEEIGGGLVDIGGYRIYRSTDSSITDWTTALVRTSAQGDTSFHDTGVLTGKTYFYRVTAFDTLYPNENESWYNDSTAGRMVSGLNIIGGDPNIDTLEIAVGGISPQKSYGCTVTLRLASDSASIVANDISDTYGVFTLSGISDGSYKLVVERAGALRRVVNITIAGGVINGGAGITIPPLVLGDCNNSGDVGVGDWSAIVSRWGTTDISADANNSGDVGVGDWSTVVRNWGKTADPL